MTLEKRLRHLIRTVPDWPKPGTQFRDLTPLLQDVACWREVVAFFAHRYRGTLLAAFDLLEQLGTLVLEAAAIVDLPELGGSARCRQRGLPVCTLIDYAGQ